MTVGSANSLIQGVTGQIRVNLNHPGQWVSRSYRDCMVGALVVYNYHLQILEVLLIDHRQTVAYPAFLVYEL